MSRISRTRGPLLWAIALSIVSGACASSGTAPKPFPMPSPRVARRTPVPPVAPLPRADAPDPIPATAAAVDRVIRTAMELRGSPYRNGGADPQGFDCSGFTKYVFAKAGTALPRDTREQFRVGLPVPLGQQQPGDLIFFTTTSRDVSHVGIALGADTFVHAPSARGVVRVESMTLPYWSRRVVGVRRVVGN